MATHSDLLDNEKLNPLSDSGKRLRKIIGTALLIFGFYYLISILFQLKYYLGPYVYVSIREQFYFALDFLYDYHVVVLISISEVVAGFLFLFNNRKAWAVGMFVVLSRLFSFLFLFFPSMIEMNSILMLLSIVIAVIYIGLLVLMVSKSFRNKYAPSKNTWMLIVGIVLIFFAESMRMLRF